MQLPGEVMDLCFGYTSGQPNLTVGDYVALAGASKYFRIHLNDDFFNELCYDQKAGECESHQYSWRQETATSTRIASRPFSRHLGDWRKDPARVKIPTPNVKSFYVPPGPRHQWTEAMHRVHEEERMKWREGEAEKILKAKAEAAAKLYELRHTDRYAAGGPRGVLAMIPGRKDGQPSVQKNWKGLPQRVQLPETWKNGNEEPHVEAAATRLWASVTGLPLDCPPDPHDISLAGDRLWASTLRGIERKRLLLERVRISMASPFADSPVDDKDLPFVVSYDYFGRRNTFDYWPSEHREAAAKHVNSMFINKTIAISTYKVSEAELISLRHFLITNHMNSNNSIQKFYKRAVESLAYRSHGGIQAHKQHVERLEAAAAKARLEKKRRGLANGTYECPPRACHCPHWWYGQCICYDDLTRCDVCSEYHY